MVELTRMMQEAFHLDRRGAAGTARDLPRRRLLWIAALLLLPALPATADTEYMVSEEAIADMMVFEDHIPCFCPATYPGEPRRPDAAKRPWTVLPLARGWRFILKAVHTDSDRRRSVWGCGARLHR